MNQVTGSARIDTPQETWYAFVLEEYKALRQEVITSLSSQQQILAFGSATIALVIGPGLELWSRSELALVIVFALFIPALSAMVIIIWFGEVLRMVRAGDALADVETKVNAAGMAAGWHEPAMTWECALRNEGETFKRFVINYRGVIAAYSLVALVSISLAFVRDLTDDHLRTATPVFTTVAISIAALTAAFMVRRWRQERDLWRNGSPSRSSTPVKGEVTHSQ